MSWHPDAGSDSVRLSIQGTVEQAASRTILRNSDGNRYFLYLDRNDDGSWDWNYNWLDNDRNRDNVSPLLATPFISLPAHWRG